MKERLDQIIWCLKYDLALLSHKDRAFIADMLETNKAQDMPKGSWLVIMNDYDELEREAAE